MPAFHGVALTKYFNTMKEIIDRTLKKMGRNGEIDPISRNERNDL